MTGTETGVFGDLVSGTLQDALSDPATRAEIASAAADVLASAEVQREVNALLVRTGLVVAGAIVAGVLVAGAVRGR